MYFAGVGFGTDNLANGMAMALGIGLQNMPEGMAVALACGAMLFVISDEIIQKTHANGYECQATYGIVVGFIVMMILDILLG